MNLRPHHALCIQKFTGHGYDEAFTRHMTAVVSALKAAPDSEITLVSGCDELCSRCPFNDGGRCASLGKVERMDRLTAGACGVSVGEEVTWRQLSLRARERVFGTEKFPEICSDCQWYGLCLGTEINS